MRAFASKMVPSFALALAGAASVAACGGQTAGIGGGGGGGGSGTVTGSVASTTFAVASTIAEIQPGSTTCAGGPGPDAGETCQTYGNVVLVALTNRGDASCAAVAASQATPNGITFSNLDVLELYVGTPTGTVAPGTFTISGPLGSAAMVTAFFGKTDATCRASLSAQATAGTITLTQVSPSSIVGSYDVTFGAQGSFQGTFDVATCDVPDAGTTPHGDGGPPTCE